MKTRRELFKDAFDSTVDAFGSIFSKKDSPVKNTESQSPFFEFSKETLFQEAMRLGIDPSCYSEDELAEVVTEKMMKK